MTNDEITLKDIHNDLRELITWTKFSGIKEVKPVLELKLDSALKRMVYHLSDGKNSTRDIEKLIGNISARSVSNYWQEWEKLGFGSYEIVNGFNRFKKSFDLKEFGINIPELQKTGKESTSETNETLEQAAGSEGNNEQQ
ncbi:hypothetical protein [Nitrosarchaeum sp. AC2]|uniref:hypothetical protein n=1 Tax=Nitrosarchaeum sp. AC2 TaxID=2259673 RepID=UPI0015CAE08D|nr:hypothetical protein [Nitrosarchaeum sp. AC2]QLH11265.1 hypothetical protein DSQ20_07175 [Nitrosarchaeum sp. AC2]